MLVFVSFMRHRVFTQGCLQRTSIPLFLFYLLFADKEIVIIVLIRIFSH